MTQIDQYGYLRLTFNNELVHRIVASLKVGRRLRWFEVVHHIDGNKENNHPDNLFICSKEFHELIHKKKIRKDKFWSFVYGTRERNNNFYRLRKNDKQ